jgi:hypothetical protein
MSLEQMDISKKNDLLFFHFHFLQWLGNRNEARRIQTPIVAPRPPANVDEEQLELLVDSFKKNEFLFWGKQLENWTMSSWIEAYNAAKNAFKNTTTTLKRRKETIIRY